MNVQQQSNVPTLQSFYNGKWAGDISADPDFLPTDPDGLAESSDDQEGGLDSEADTDEEEDGDISTKEWYVLWLIKV
jgi:hypothetical protein